VEPLIAAMSAKARLIPGRFLPGGLHRTYHLGPPQPNLTIEHALRCRPTSGTFSHALSDSEVVGIPQASLGYKQQRRAFSPDLPGRVESEAVGCRSLREQPISIESVEITRTRHLGEALRVVVAACDTRGFLQALFRLSPMWPSWWSGTLAVGGCSVVCPPPLSTSASFGSSSWAAGVAARGIRLGGRCRGCDRD
jgi:hypothetical protein